MEQQNISKLKQWKKMIKKWCSKTTLRALPRVSKAQSFKTRVFWFGIFAFLVSGACVCIYFIILTYLNYQTYVEVTTLPGEYSDFPSVTICAHQPVDPDSTRLLSSLNYTPKALAVAFEDWAKEYQKKIRNQTGQQDYVTTIPYPRYSSFYQYFPDRNVVKNFGRRQNHFIYNCIFYAKSQQIIGDNGYFEYCLNHPDKILITQVTDPSYFNCFMFTFEKNYIQTANGMSFQLNMETYNIKKDKAAVETCNQCMRWRPETWRQGVRIVIHPPDTRPNIQKDGIDLDPGSVNEIYVETTRIKSLKAPHGNCTDNIEKTTIVDKGNTFLYTDIACKEKALQERLKAICHCIDPTTPMAEIDEQQIRNQTFTFCENINLLEGKPTDKDLNKIKCSLKVKKEFSSQMCSHCTKPCLYHEYKSIIKSTYGFDKSMLVAMYKILLKEGITKRKIPEIEDIINDINNRNYSSAFDKLNRDNYLMNNFIQVSVKRSAFAVTVEDEKESVKLPNLLSMIGGICSLFVGFSLFVIVEVAELIIHTALLFKNKMNNEQNTQYRNNDNARREVNGIENSCYWDVGTNGTTATKYYQPRLNNDHCNNNNKDDFHNSHNLFQVEKEFGNGIHMRWKPSPTSQNDETASCRL